jgi:hypothetical protein
MRRLTSVITLCVAASAFLGGRVIAATSDEIGGSVQMELFGGSTYHLTGSRAIVSVGTVTADSGNQTVLPAVGFALNTWFGQKKIFGTFIDFSDVDGGKATAHVGANSAQVNSNLFDFHGGFQVQAPGRHFRPYASLGGGFAHPSINGSITLLGTTNNVNSSQTVSSLTYGGGVRYMFGQNWGMRTALEGVNMSSFQKGGGNANYGRVLVGLFWSSSR